MIRSSRFSILLTNISGDLNGPCLLKTRFSEACGLPAGLSFEFNFSKEICVTLSYAKKLTSLTKCIRTTELAGASEGPLSTTNNHFFFNCPVTELR